MFFLKDVKYKSVIQIIEIITNRFS